MSVCGRQGVTALMYAARGGHLDCVKALLEEKGGAELLNQQTTCGCTALSMAAEEGKSMAVGILIQSKADVNLPIKDGSTALMHASKGGHYGSVEALLDKGANAATKMNATDKANAGMNSAMWAAQLGHLEILKLLLDKGCLLYTSDAADEGLGVDLGGRRII